MNSLTNVIKQCLLRKHTFAVTTAVRNAGAWNKDWKPGPYPKTQAERDAAAKKYGLHPKDYQPYPDDGTGFGDYPMFEPVSMESRNSFEHYDMPELKRNWQEVLHVDYDAHTAERFDCNKKYLTPIHLQLLYYLGGMTLMISYFVWDAENRDKPPLMLQQYPGDGKKHYTFEIEQ